MARKTLIPHENALRTVIVDFMEARGLKPTPWATKAGVPESTFRSFLNGQARAPRHDTLEKLSAAAGVSLAEMLSGKPTKQPKDVPSNATEPAPESLTDQTINVKSWSRDLPILGAGACGEDGLFELNGQTHGFERRPPRLVGVKDAYALWVIGSSMSPWRRNGQIVIVHPHQPVNIGDYVVVQLKPDGTGAHGAYIKELVRRTAKEVRLKQYSPEEEIAIPMSKVASIHRIPTWDELVLG